MSKTWRECARPIIAQVLADNKDKSEKDIRMALRDAYPWGVRAMHPYKIGCDEIKVQMKTKPPKPSKQYKNPDQNELFN